jgi:hypothetical protein
MQLSRDRFRVELTTRGCEIPPEELARIQTWLSELGDRLRDFPDPSLEVRVIHHPRREVYRAEFRLELPGRVLVTGDEDSYLDSVLQRGFAKLTRKAEEYRDRPDREAVDAAERRVALDRDIVAPEAPDAGPLGEAAAAGDYRTFRTTLARYEEWLRNRAGRLIQRNPTAQAQVGRRELRIGDVVEEAYLNAFERFTRRPTDVPLSVWLEGLVEPSIRDLLRNPDEERAAASFARTVRDGPLG